jgi:hypothetical protein
MPISVGDYEHIQSLVGGHFDCVRVDYDPVVFENEPGAKEILGDGPATPFVAVGYVHDEGLLLELPVNPMASVVLQREIVGPCVLVSGSSPNGYYDGDNHDLPEWFANAVFQGGLHDVAESLRDIADFESTALVLAAKDGLFTEEQFGKLVYMISSGDPKYDETITKALEIATLYAVGQMTGAVEKFDRSEYERFQQTLVVTDEDINNFWEQEGNK